MSFEFKKCPINGLYEIQPELHGDKDCNLTEIYVEKDFVNAGLTLKFVQDNQSQFSKNFLYGLRFQKNHSQGKLVRAIFGKIYYVAVDLRNCSPSFGKYIGIILDGDKQNQFYIESGFAHGFIVLSDKAILEQKFSDFYHPEDEDGIDYRDSSIGIEWEKVSDSDVFELNEKDKNRKPFESNGRYFDNTGKWLGV